MLRGGEAYNLKTKRGIINKDYSGELNEKVK